MKNNSVKSRQLRSTMNGHTDASEELASISYIYGDSTLAEARSESMRRMHIRRRVAAGVLAVSALFMTEHIVAPAVANFIENPLNRKHFVPAETPVIVGGSTETSTVWGIARDYCPETEDIREAVAWIMKKNGISNQGVQELQPGSSLVIPENC